MTQIPKVKTTAHELKRELRSSLESVRNGNAAKWAVFEELRLGTGFSTDRASDRRYAKMRIEFLRKLEKKGQTEHYGLPIADEIARLEDQHPTSPPDRRESRIDMFAICTWPSSNYERRAYEIKVDRGDLRKELANPDKRAPWLEVVNGFYLVIPKGLATVAEIAEQAPECGVITYTPMPEKPRLRDLCSCEPKVWRGKKMPGSSSSYAHPVECPYREPAEVYERAQRGRRINTVRPAMKLDGCEPSWGLVASILRSAAR